MLPVMTPFDEAIVRAGHRHFTGSARTVAKRTGHGVALARVRHPDWAVTR